MIEVSLYCGEECDTEWSSEVHFYGPEYEMGFKMHEGGSELEVEHCPKCGRKLTKKEIEDALGEGARKLDEWNDPFNHDYPED